MNWFGMAAAGLLGASMAAPAQALTREQENCLQYEASDQAHRDLVDEFLRGPESDTAFNAMVGAARACAVSTEVDPALHDAYVNFAVANSLRESLYDRLNEAEYPVDVLGDALYDASEASANPADIFDTESGLTDDAIGLVADFMARRGEEFAPDDEGTMQMLGLYLGAIANIAAVYDLLFDD